ncbi:3D domain-containing protein [Paenibacillus pasadenensis]|uniref:3D domain-containing protein n=1 Tax=Paenibacillus pasadenensis TaxID=217090 RepID=UPI002040EA67|nr:3D domain-containing protein [Paenibacillus pasadenensis]MCM3748252.1 3D domain-containing protein [Paenibacillus pasadenensis]
MQLKTKLFNIVKTAAAALAGIAIFAAPAPAFAAYDYNAKSGDTFWELSRTFDVSLERLIELNQHVEPTNIYVGLKLSIPGSAKKPPVSAKAESKVKAASLNTTPKLLKKDDGAKHVVASGKTYQVSRELNVKASAYTSAASENGKWGAVDYFGNPLKVGTVAVDPKKIPLGTKLYITGYDYNGLPTGGMIATASDVGGAIKGDRVDLFVPGTTAQAKKFGYQWVKVHVLKA